MKKTTGQLLSEIQSYGQERAFVANVVQVQHRNPHRKLTGLLNLLKAGYSVTTGQFNLDVLLINGVKASWIVLEEWEHRTA